MKYNLTGQPQIKINASRETVWEALMYIFIFLFDNGLLISKK